jgi:hypothetical protein
LGQWYSKAKRGQRKSDTRIVKQWGSGSGAAAVEVGRSKSCSEETKAIHAGGIKAVGVAYLGSGTHEVCSGGVQGGSEGIVQEPMGFFVFFSGNQAVGRQASGRRQRV